jgi:hypothetical protein
MANEFQRMLGGPESNTLPVTGNVELLDTSLPIIGNPDVNATDWL